MAVYLIDNHNNHADLIVSVTVKIPCHRKFIGLLMRYPASLTYIWPHPLHVNISLITCWRCGQQTSCEWDRMTDDNAWLITWFHVLLSASLCGHKQCSSVLLFAHYQMKACRLKHIMCILNWLDYHEASLYRWGGGAQDKHSAMPFSTCKVHTNMKTAAILRDYYHVNVGTAGQMLLVAQ